MKRFIVCFACSALVLTQTYAVAGPSDEGIAAGQASLPGIRSTVSTPSASTTVPGYTTTPAQSALYRTPNLTGQANAQLAACANTPNDPVCQAQLTATQSANTPRPYVGPYDPSVAASRGITRNPTTVLGDLSQFYSGCTTTTTTTPPGDLSRMCNRFTEVGAYACRKDLTVDVQMTPSCEIGEWFAQATATRNALDHMYAQAQCRVSTDGTQHFKFYADGAMGACTDWLPATLSKAISTEPVALGNLSPHWNGSCVSPFAVVEMPGSGCTNGSCSYSFQFGTPIYQCPAGSIPGDQLQLLGGDTPVPGPADQCFATSAPIDGADGLTCPAGMQTALTSLGDLTCIANAGAGKVVGASGWTLPLAFDEPKMNVVQTDQWDGKCPALPAGGRCNVVSTERCVDGPATKKINGQDVTRDCWAYEETMSCTGGATNDECAPLVAAGCTPSGSTCVKTDPVTGDCAQYQDTYECPSPGETVTSTSNCPTDVFCLGASCFNISYANDADFARSMSLMEAGREAGVYLDLDKLTVFKGEADTCGDRLLKNCCFTDGKGHDMTNNSLFGTGSRLVYDLLMNSGNREFVTAGLQALMSSGGFSGTYTSYGFTLAVNGSAVPAGTTVLYSSSEAAGEGFVIAFDPWSLAIAVVVYVVLTLMECSEGEGRLALQRGASLCHEVGSYCSSRILGICVTTTHAHCCFNSVLSRIINEQGRPQIGKAWGTAQAPDCSGFTIAQLQTLNFAAMDLTEFYASIVPTLPNAGAITNANVGRVPTCYYGQGKC